MTDRYALWDAAYVLGSLSSTERREYEAHLAGCKACRTAVGELSGVPALLGMLSRDEAAALDQSGSEPPPMRPELLDGLLDRVSRRRRRVRLLGWGASAAAAAILAVGLVLAARSGPAVSPAPEQPRAAATSVTMTPVSPSSLVATVALTSRGWGTHVEMTCTYPSSGSGPDDDPDRLAMVAVGRDGTRVQLATWMAVEDTTATPAGSTSMNLRDIAAVQVVAADTGTVLLQRDL